eukprot:751828-Hanusia_phi.AAC.9
MRAIPEASMVRRKQVAGDKDADVRVDVSRLLHGEPSSLDMSACQMLRLHLLDALSERSEWESSGHRNLEGATVAQRQEVAVETRSPAIRMCHPGPVLLMEEESAA